MTNLQSASRNETLLKGLKLESVKIRGQQREREKRTQRRKRRDGNASACDLRSLSRDYCSLFNSHLAKFKVGVTKDISAGFVQRITRRCYRYLLVYSNIRFKTKTPRALNITDAYKVALSSPNRAEIIQELMSESCFEL